MNKLAQARAPGRPSSMAQSAARVHCIVPAAKRAAYFITQTWLGAAGRSDNNCLDVILVNVCVKVHLRTSNASEMGLQFVQTLAAGEDADLRTDTIFDNKAAPKAVAVLRAAELRP